MRSKFTFLAFILFGMFPVHLRGPESPAPKFKTAEQLYAVYLARDYFSLQEQFDSLDPADQTRDFFAGQLHAAFLQDDQAEEKLHRFLALPNTAADWRKEAWLTLGNVHLRRGDYDVASWELVHALYEPGAVFTAAEKTDAEQNLTLARALHGSPPPSESDHAGPSTVNSTRTEDGLLYIDVRVNGSTEQYLVDTGTNICAMSETIARLHHLRMLPDRMDVLTSTGKLIPAGIGLADTVQIDAMTFHNVVFGAFSNQQNLPVKLGFDSSKIVGLPLLLALKHLRVAADGSSVEVGLPSKSVSSAATGNLAFKGLMPLARLQYQGNPLPFLLDSGSYTTVLYSRFTQRFPEALTGATAQNEVRAGLGLANQTVISGRVLPQVQLNIGNVPVMLHDVFTQPAEEFFGSSVVGVAGANLLKSGFDLDFRRMELSVKTPAP